MAMANTSIDDARERKRSLMDKSDAPSHNDENGGGGGGMSDLERRVATLETDVRAIRDDVHELKTDVAVLKANSANYATKADIAGLKVEIHKEFTSQTWKMVTLVIAALGGLTAIQRYLPPKSEQGAVQVSLPPEFYEAIKPAPPKAP